MLSGWVMWIKPTGSDYSIGYYWNRNRNWKWWWAIFLWAFEYSLTNMYVLYRKFDRGHDKEPPCTHYEFVRQVALIWLKPSSYWHANASM